MVLLWQKLLFLKQSNYEDCLGQIPDNRKRNLEIMWHFGHNNIMSDFMYLIWCVQVLNALPDQDTFYDVTDSLEEQGIEAIVQRHMNRKGADLDLLEQFQIYESVLKHEDGDESGPIAGGNIENLRYTCFQRHVWVIISTWHETGSFKTWLFWWNNSYGFIGNTCSNGSTHR